MAEPKLPPKSPAGGSGGTDPKKVTHEQGPGSQPDGTHDPSPNKPVNPGK